ncbi:MAG: NAD(P)H-hydrate dehydratase [Clostridia bacterium]|nr:NAD(P)H-hydrate dehydratase [Clostridia bacterium]
MTNYTVFSYADQERPTLPPRPQNSNKKTFGRVLCLCGCEGMAGAAYLAAKAAYRTGAGLVELCTPAVNRPVLQTLIPEAVVTVYDESNFRDRLTEALERADAAVIGCGLGQSALSSSVLAFALRHKTVPAVLDADGLNLLAKHPALWGYAKGDLLTPHPLELSRLTGRSVEDLLADEESSAYETARRFQAVCVLKTHRTAVSDGGDRLYRNQTGNSGMATGGSGDVLAGILGGLLAQRKHLDRSPLELAALGVYLHGMAGDLAADALGEYSVMASDLLAHLPQAMKQI